MYLTISLKGILLGVFIDVYYMVCIMWLIFCMHSFAFWALQVLNLFSDTVYKRHLWTNLKTYWHIILFTISGLLTSDGIMWCLMHFKLWPVSSILIMCSLGSAFQSSEILGSLTGALSEYIYVMFESSLTAHQRLIRINWSVWAPANSNTLGEVRVSRINWKNYCPVLLFKANI